MDEKIKSKIKKVMFMLILPLIIIFAFVIINFNPEPNEKEKSLNSDKNVIELILPVNAEDVVFNNYGIWPFGVRGGDHPEGHPGIDFELEEGDPIFAVASGKILNVEDSGHYGFKTATLSVNETLSVYYTGSLNFVVSEGEIVEKGQIIAYAVMSEVVNEASFHFETFNTKTSFPECPLNYLFEESKTDLEKLFGKSKYQEKEEFPLLCNPCPDCRR